MHCEQNALRNNTNENTQQNRQRIISIMQQNKRGCLPGVVLQ